MSTNVFTIEFREYDIPTGFSETITWGVASTQENAINMCTNNEVGLPMDKNESHLWWWYIQETTLDVDDFEFPEVNGREPVRIYLDWDGNPIDEQPFFGYNTEELEHDEESEESEAGFYYSPENFMNLREFMDTGYLLEANREFFHPLGLAMVFNQDTENLDDVEFVGFADSRSDPEGGIFSELDDVDRARSQSILDEWTEKAITRLDKFGWVVQPIDEVPNLD